MPDMPGSYSEDGFHRQRRNLIVGSIVLFFIHLADVRLGDTPGATGTVLGLPATVGKPGVIQWFLFVAVLYWGWRFYTFHRQRRPTEMQTTVRGYMENYLRPHAISCISPEPPTFDPPAGLKKGRTAKLVPHNFGLAHPLKRQMIEAKVTPAWIVMEADTEKEIISEKTEYPVVFKGCLMWRARLLAYAHTSVNTPAFSEYHLPYIVALVAIGNALFAFSK